MSIRRSPEGFAVSVCDCCEKIIEKLDLPAPPVGVILCRYDICGTCCTSAHLGTNDSQPIETSPTMNYNDYIQLALATEAPFPSNDIRGDTAPVLYRMFHAALGLATEMTELPFHKFDATIVEWADELSDMWWYTALLSDTLKIYPREENPVVPSDMTHLGNTRKLLDVIKKKVYYPAEFSLPTFIETLAPVFQQHYASLIALTNKYTKAPVEETWKYNIEKLAKRYPAKFTQWHAENRKE